MDIHQPVDDNIHEVDETLFAMLFQVEHSSSHGFK